MAIVSQERFRKHRKCFGPRFNLRISVEHLLDLASRTSLQLPSHQSSLRCRTLMTAELPLAAPVSWDSPLYGSQYLTFVGSDE